MREGGHMKEGGHMSEGGHMRYSRRQKKVPVCSVSVLHSCYCVSVL